MDVIDRGQRHPADPHDDVQLVLCCRRGPIGGDRVTAWVDEAVQRAGRASSPAPAPPIRSAAARRRVSRRSLVLSVLVILLGGLLALAAGQMLTAHDEVLAVARDVQVGTTITADDLTVASFTADPKLSPIPASQLSDVVGKVAQVPLIRGGLLTRDQVGTG